MSESERMRCETSRDARELAMCDARDTSQYGAVVQTDVAVYLGDCTGDTLDVVCDGLSTERAGSTSQRALLALACPTPRGPYPVANRFTLFVHETVGGAVTGRSTVVTFRIDVRCEGRWAYASVRSGQSLVDLPPIPYVIGDDVVTIARRVCQTT